MISTRSDIGPDMEKNLFIMSSSAGPGCGHGNAAVGPDRASPNCDADSECARPPGTGRPGPVQPETRRRLRLPVGQPALGGVPTSTFGAAAAGPRLSYSDTGSTSLDRPGSDLDSRVSVVSQPTRAGATARSRARGELGMISIRVGLAGSQSESCESPAAPEASGLRPVCRRFGDQNCDAGTGSFKIF
jgi:hypothetical protein